MSKERTLVADGSRCKEGDCTKSETFVATECFIEIDLASGRFGECRSEISTPAVSLNLPLAGGGLTVKNQIDCRRCPSSTWATGRSKSRLGMLWPTAPSLPHSYDLTGKIELFQVPIWSTDKSYWPAPDPYLRLRQFPSATDIYPRPAGAASSAPSPTPGSTGCL